jgi:hypothetical protein
VSHAKVTTSGITDNVSHNALPFLTGVTKNTESVKDVTNPVELVVDQKLLTVLPVSPLTS